MRRPAPTRALVCAMQLTSQQTSPTHTFFQFPFQARPGHSTLRTFKGAAMQHSSLRLTHRMHRQQQRGPTSTPFFPPPIEFWTLLAVSSTRPCRSAKPLRSSCFWRNRSVLVTLFSGATNSKSCWRRILASCRRFRGTQPISVLVSLFLRRWGLWREREASLTTSFFSFPSPLTFSVEFIGRLVFGYRRRHAWAAREKIPGYQDRDGKSWGYGVFLCSGFSAQPPRDEGRLGPVTCNLLYILGTCFITHDV